LICFPPLVVLLMRDLMVTGFAGWRRQNGVELGDRERKTPMNTIEVIIASLALIVAIAQLWVSLRDRK